MHEGSIARSILDTAKEIAEKEDMRRVKRVKVAIGKMHSVVPEVLLNLFNIMKKYYPGLEDASLDIEEKEVKIRCKRCGSVSILDSPFFICEACGSGETEVLEGDEMLILSIEGEKE